MFRRKMKMNTQVSTFDQESSVLAWSGYLHHDRGFNQDWATYLGIQQSATLKDLCNAGQPSTFQKRDVN